MGEVKSPESFSQKTGAPYRANFRGIKQGGYTFSSIMSESHINTAIVGKTVTSNSVIIYVEIV